MQVAQTDNEEDKKLITEGDEHTQLDANKITSDLHVLPKKSNRKLEKAMPKVETEKKHLRNSLNNSMRNVYLNLTI